MVGLEVLWVGFTLTEEDPALQADSLPTELSGKPDYLPTKYIREYIFFLALKKEKHSKSIGHVIRGRKMI